MEPNNCTSKVVWGDKESIIGRPRKRGLTCGTRASTLYIIKYGDLGFHMTKNRGPNRLSFTSGGIHRNDQLPILKKKKDRRRKLYAKMAEDERFMNLVAHFADFLKARNFDAVKNRQFRRNDKRLQHKMEKLRGPLM